MNRIELYGHIDKLGNPIISSNEIFKEFFKSNPKKQFIIEVNAYEKGTTDHHVWYIIKMIVPAFIRGHSQIGHALTPSDAILTIIESCPFFYKTKKIKYKFFDFDKWKPDCEMSTEELEMAIEWLHLFCLENFDIAIGNYKSL
jgi:hypothetical protein